MARPSLAYALALLAPAAAAAQTLNFGIRPGDDPSGWAACTLSLNAGWFTLSEVKGMGPPPERPVRWPAGARDTGLFTAAIEALASGDLPETGVADSRMPAPPDISVTWTARRDAGLRSGFHVLPGLSLPPVLKAVIRGMVPGSICDRALGPG